MTSTLPARRPEALRALLTAFALVAAPFAQADTGSAGSSQALDNYRPSVAMAQAVQLSNGLYPLRDGTGDALGGTLGFVYSFAGNFAPGGAMANGQTVLISQATPAFSLLGNAYGGNGVTQFMLPSLGGRAVVGAGTTPELTPHAVGAVVGAASVSLPAGALAGHDHARPGAGRTGYAGKYPADAFGSLQPALAMTRLIAVSGAYPTRDGGLIGVPAFIGQIATFAGNFAPVGWLPADGRALLVSQYPDLFSVIGTRYGGNGTTTFNLPNLVGRVTIGADFLRPVGWSSGTETRQLDAGNLPAHAHADPRGGTTGSAGNGAAIANGQPSVAITYLIAPYGVYPSPGPSGFNDFSPLVAQVTEFAGDYAPDGWMKADGTVVSIASNPALFNVLGTAYGGDGVNVFALPDLRGRTLLGINPSTGQYPVFQQGDVVGSETIALSVAAMPAHVHPTPATVPAAPTIGTATAGAYQASVAFTPPAIDGESAIVGYTATCDPGGKTGTGTASPLVVANLAGGVAVTCTVRATNGVGTSASSAPSNAVTPPFPQTIDFPDPGPQAFGTTPTLAAASSASLAVTFSSETTAVCTVSAAGTLAFVATGTCTIDADAAGNTAYLPAARVTRSFTVYPVPPGPPTGVVATAGDARARVSFTAPAFAGGAAIAGYTVTSDPGGFTASGAASPLTVTGLANGVAYTFTVRATNGAGAGSASLPSAPVVPVAMPDLAVTAEVSPPLALLGHDVRIGVTVSNTGHAPASAVAFHAAMPDSMTLVWMSTGCARVVDDVTCAVGTLAPGASVPFRLVMRPVVTGASLGVRTAVSLAEVDGNPDDNGAAIVFDVLPSPAAVAVQRWRLFSPVTKEHHFTTDANEYNTLGGYIGTWVQEGPVGKVLDNPGPWNGVVATPYYRLYNTANAQHHWTTDANEYYTLIQFPQYNAEGVDGWILPTQAAATIPLYRLLYPYSIPVAGLHHWTIDAVEYSQLISVYGWVGEGGSGYVIP